MLLMIPFFIEKSIDKSIDKSIEKSIDMENQKLRHFLKKLVAESILEEKSRFKQKKVNHEQNTFFFFMDLSAFLSWDDRVRGWVT